MLKQIKAIQVQAGDLIKVEDKTFKIVHEEKGYNAVSVFDDTHYADSEDTPSLEQYVKDWLHTWDEQVEFYREVKEFYTLTEMLKFAETNNFKAIISKFNDYEIKVEDGVMHYRDSDNQEWKNAVVSIWWNNRTYKIDEDSIVNLGRNLLND